MRAVMYAFAELKEYHRGKKDKEVSWLEYAKWFTGALNQLETEGWFKSFDDLEREKRKFLEHLAFDPSGSIINYKFADVEDALGAILVLLVAVRGKLGKDHSAEVWEDTVDRLRKPLIRGFRKVHKAELKDFKGTQEQLRAEVNKRATTSVNRRQNVLHKYLELD